MAAHDAEGGKDIVMLDAVNAPHGTSHGLDGFDVVQILEGGGIAVQVLVGTVPIVDDAIVVVQVDVQPQGGLLHVADAENGTGLLACLGQRREKH